jgi:hypothetical protein
MERNLFELLCEELGYDQTNVLVIRLKRREVTVTYTEPSGMPRSSAHRIEQDGRAATRTAA